MFLYFKQIRQVKLSKTDATKHKKTLNSILKENITNQKTRKTTTKNGSLK
jgi:hypothetical protein